MLERVMSGIPRWSSGLRLCALLLRAWIQTLVRELRSCKLRDMAWREEKKGDIYGHPDLRPHGLEGALVTRIRGKGPWTHVEWGRRKEVTSENLWRDRLCMCEAWLRGPETFRAALLLFSCSIMSDCLRPNELQHARLPCPSLSPRGCSDSCTLSRWCHPTISSSVFPFSSCLQSFPASGSFPVSQFFASGGQSIVASASASVLPMCIQGWFQGNRIWEQGGRSEAEGCLTSNPCPVGFWVMMVLAWLQLREKLRRYLTHSRSCWHQQVVMESVRRDAHVRGSVQRTGTWTAGKGQAGNHNLEDSQD